MSPLSGEPRVVEIEPPDDGANVERRLNRIQFVPGTGNACSMADRCPRYDRPEQLRAGGICKCENAARERVRETPARGVHRLVARTRVVERVVGEVRKERVGGR